ncbi:MULTISPECIES: metalloregulator ArsR/SmtB family transcription factor [unclassified Pseudactinotalea]|uniref:helix-turn-helix transcriptional regulator n=1 Tax=unclassified Pseudactinotalea TaxID=2649176 RepID=UPI00128C0B32|nr:MULTISPECIES: helix-turn-helix domain-containing protein [unclassified Pseudactinotalea]MPV49132.1 ArsR family transcriptional regulator [Pseudactinotalea sp. HY160]QGH68199.1 ArsR family transcriptional regulator [Pseudactinotalea sp. HY158]
MSSHTSRTALAELSSLADPLRRRLYDFVVAQDAPVGRDEAATAVEIGRTLAAYHLDKLAGAGLLDVSYARREGRTGPGAGRPAKLYARAEREVAASVPPRNYALLARLLAGAAAADETGEVSAALARAAAAEGTRSADGGADLLDALTGLGFEPAVSESGDITLRNCPFHAIAQHQSELVCGMNHALIRGLLSGAGSDPDRAELAPRPGRCCVVIHPAGARPAGIS